MLIQQKSQQPSATLGSRVAHQIITTTMAAKMDSNCGILPGDEESTPELHGTIPGQQIGQLPVDSGMPLETNPSNLEPRTTTPSQVLDDIPWDVGPSFAYFPTHFQASHLSGQGVPSQGPNMRQWQEHDCQERSLSSTPGKDTSRPSHHSPNYLGETAYMSSRGSLWSETSPLVSYGAYLILGQSDIDDIWGLQELTPQGLELEYEAQLIPSTPSHIRDTLERPPFSRASTSTVAPKSESGHPECRQSRSSASPGESRTPSPTRRWACRKCDKIFQDRTTLNKHLRYHSRPFNCPTCPRQFSVPKDLKRHQKTTGHGGEDIKELACSEKGCPFKYKTCRNDSYRRHLKLKHRLSPGGDMKSGTGVKCTRAMQGEEVSGDVSCVNVD